MIKKPASLHGLRDLLAAQGYDVLTDVRMPKRDGFEVCRELRTAEATRLTPVILVTGAAETDDLDSAEAVLRSLALTIELGMPTRKVTAIDSPTVPSRSVSCSGSRKRI